MVIASSLEESAQHLREEGWVTVPDVFVGEELEGLRAGLAAGLDAARAEGQILFREGVDVNDRSVRVLHLLDQHPAFGQMVDDATVRGLVSSVLGEQYLLSSLSANISLPGSESMGIHNDLMAVLPEPWLAPYGTNLFICLDDMDEENGATRYLPGSHRFTTNDMASEADLGRTVPIPATAVYGTPRAPTGAPTVPAGFSLRSTSPPLYGRSTTGAPSCRNRRRPDWPPTCGSCSGSMTGTWASGSATPPSAVPSKASTRTPTDH
jgi:hypothetical protein